MMRESYSMEREDEDSPPANDGYKIERVGSNDRSISSITDKERKEALEAINRCTLCESSFSLTRRKHTCRSCGKILCAKCSTVRDDFPKLPPKSRVCEVCYEYYLWSFSKKILTEKSSSSLNILEESGKK